MTATDKVIYQELGFVEVTKAMMDAFQKLVELDLHLAANAQADGADNGGMRRAIQEDRGNERRIELVRIEDEKDKKLKRAISDIARIASEIAALQKEQADLEGKMGGLGNMAKDVGIQFDGTESEEKKKQKIQDEYNAIIARGGSLNKDQKAWLSSRKKEQELARSLDKANGLVSSIETLEKKDTVPEDMREGLKSEYAVTLASGGTLNQDQQAWYDLQGDKEQAHLALGSYIDAAPENVIINLADRTQNSDTLKVVDTTQIKVMLDGGVDEANTTSETKNLADRGSALARLRASRSISPEGELNIKSLPELSENFEVAALGDVNVSVNELEPVQIQQVDLNFPDRGLS